MFPFLFVHMDFNSNFHKRQENFRIDLYMKKVPDLSVSIKGNSYHTISIRKHGQSLTWVTPSGFINKLNREFGKIGGGLLSLNAFNSYPDVVKHSLTGTTSQADIEL